MTKISVLMFIFLFWRIVLPMGCKWFYKIPVSVLILLVSFKFKVIRHLGGSYFAPDLPCWFILSFAFLYAVAFILAIMIIPIDLTLFFHTAYRMSREFAQKKFAVLKYLLKPHKLLGKAHAAALALSVFLAVVGVCCGLAMPRVRYVTVKCAGLPAEAENLKIAVMADLHVDHYNGPARIKKIVDRVNTLDPDIVCIAGDFVDGRSKWHLDALSQLKNLRSRGGVFGVPGNHEYYSGYRIITDHLKASGLVMLLNESVYLPQYKVRMCGVTDRQAKRYKQQLPDLEKALSGGENDFKILLSHRPETARRAAELGASVQFSGHTHGGMVWLFDRIIALSNGGFAWGEHQIGDMTLVICNGTCIWSSFPVRLGRPGEILLVTLRKK